mgnify:CR=1 FL=1
MNLARHTEGRKYMVSFHAAGAGPLSQLREFTARTSAVSVETEARQDGGTGGAGAAANTPSKAIPSATGGGFSAEHAPEEADYGRAVVPLAVLREEKPLPTSVMLYENMELISSLRRISQAFMLAEQVGCARSTFERRFTSANIGASDQINLQQRLARSEKGKRVVTTGHER